MLKLLQIALSVFIGSIFLLPQSDVKAQQAMTSSRILTENCGLEINRLCADVRPGTGRTIACIYSHTDKISRLCYLALFSVSRQLEAAMIAFRKAEFECRSSINAHCSGIQPGGGRVMNCLVRNRHRLATKECTDLVNQLRLQ